MSVLAIFSLAFAGATALYVLALPMWASMALFLLAILTWGLICFLPKLKGKHFRLVAAGVALGLLWSFVYETWQIRPLKELEGETMELRLVAIEEGTAQDWGARVLCTYDGVRTVAYLDRGENGSPTVNVGDVISMTGYLQAVTVEEDLPYLSKDIRLIAHQEGDLSIAHGEETVGNLPARWYSQVRARIRQLFPADTAPFALALLTGDTGELSYGFRNQMALAGVSHVVAVSGMHVSLICALVLNLCLRRKRLAAGICLGAMWFFGAMLGFSPSVTRAVLMNSVLLLAPFFKREYDSLTALGFALLLLLVKNPFSVSSVGLQLSFASVGGILLFTQPIAENLMKIFPAKWRRQRVFRKFITFLTTSVGTTMGACIFTVPLGAYYFETVSIISVLSNVILLPVITAMFTLGYPVVILSYFLYPVAELMAQWMSVPIRWILSGIEFLGNVPYGALYSRSIFVVLWLIATYCLIALGVTFKRKVLPLLLSLVMLIAVPFLQKIPTESFAFTMLDVGQGQCLVAEVGSSVVVIDCGGSQEEASGENAARELQSRGKFKIDALILTHFDLDHTGGVLQLMERMEITRLYLPDIPTQDGKKDRILQKAEELAIPIVWVRGDMSLLLDGGSLTIFAPVTTKTENDGLCLLLSASDYDILVTGDLSLKGERQLLLSKALPDIEILIAGHHGSADSTGQELLNYTAPEELLISVGRNSHGHPSKQVLERACALGITVRRTDQDGTIRITR